jgi:hypothetical protein
VRQRFGTPRSAGYASGPEPLIRPHSRAIAPRAPATEGRAGVGYCPLLGVAAHPGPARRAAWWRRSSTSAMSSICSGREAAYRAVVRRSTCPSLAETAREEHPCEKSRRRGLPWPVVVAEPETREVAAYTAAWLVRRRGRRWSGSCSLTTPIAGWSPSAGAIATGSGSRCGWAPCGSSARLAADPTDVPGAVCV